MEITNTTDYSVASVCRKAEEFNNGMEAHGFYNVKCIKADGTLRWEDTAQNLVTTVGKNFLLNNALRSNVAPGAFIGLISSVSWSAVAAGDTMASHAGWYEVAAATYFPTVAARLGATFASDSTTGTISSNAASFTIITNGGTIKGCFLVLGTGASATLGNTGGTLYSAGAFSGGDKTVGIGDTVQVTYTTSLT